jgi:putative ABC transport system permease protein
MRKIQASMGQFLEWARGPRFRLPGSRPQTMASFGTRLGDVLASLSAMLVVVFKRLRHNTGLTASAVIGIIAVMAMVVCVPLFSHAISSKVLREQLLERAQETNRSLFSLHMYYIDKRSATPLRVDTVEKLTGYVQQIVLQTVDLPTRRIVPHIETANMGWLPSDTSAASVRTDEAWMSMSLASADLVREKGKIIDGRWPENTKTGPVQVAVLERTADEFFINVGDRFRYQTLEIEVAGIWEPMDPENTQDTTWFENPLSGYRDKLWVPKETYRDRLDKIMDRSIYYVDWYVVVDDEAMRLDQAPRYARGLVQLDADMRRVLPGVETDYTPIEALEEYRERANTLATLFYAVSGPMIVLALMFISLTANIAVQQYEQETATMRGRGTSWFQVAALNLIESAVLILAALPLALLAGWLSALIMGQTLSFLKFTFRQGIEVNLQGINYLWLGLAALFVLLARFFPVLNISRSTIVRVKQEQSRATHKPVWERFFLDFLLLLPGLYFYVTLKGMAEPFKFLESVQPTGETYQDPLLFVAPSLFAMGLCMVLLRLLPFLLRGLGLAVDNLPRVWAFLSIQQVARRPQDHSSALLLIMISLSLAIYSASTAKTLDRWLHDSAYYKSGADLVVREFVLEAVGGGFGPGSSAPNFEKRDLSVDGYFDVSQHLKLPSVENVTRVGRYEGTFSYGVGELPARFMGIDRLEFPRVAFYRDDFSSQSLGAMMNALALDPGGVLVPEAKAQEIGLRVGDRLNVDLRVVDQTVSKEMVIVGTYEFFPTIYPEAKPTLIVNLEYLFDGPEGVVGYDVWLDLRENTDMEVLLYQIGQMINPELAVVEVQGNALQEVQEMMDQPERVGLFGVLNVGFLATGLMPGIGFVLYSYASLRRRFIQLGILQAIGLSVKQLIGYLVLEQVLLMSIAILSGAAIGLLSSYMFVPFLQVGASRVAPVPPFEVLIGWAESGLLSVVFGLILFLTVVGTISYLAHMKVFQAVKMGEAM